jgi:hypothetical protein
MVVIKLALTIAPRGGVVFANRAGARRPTAVRHEEDVARQLESVGAAQPRDKARVEHGSLGGVMCANRVVGIQDIKPCVGASGHGTKRDDAQKECVEGTQKRPPNRSDRCLHVLFLSRNGERKVGSELSGVENEPTSFCAFSRSCTQPDRV